MSVGIVITNITKKHNQTLESRLQDAVFESEGGERERKLFNAIFSLTERSKPKFSLSLRHFATANDYYSLGTLIFAGLLSIFEHALRTVADVARVQDEVTHRTLLHVAAQEGRLDMVKLLLRKGMNPNVKTKNACNTPLHSAAEKGQWQVVRCLLRHERVSRVSADVENPLKQTRVRHKTVSANVQNALKQTPLHLAAMKGHMRVIKELLDVGGDPWARDLLGKTAEDWARQKNHTRVASLLARTISLSLSS